MRGLSSRRFQNSERVVNCSDLWPLALALAQPSVFFVNWCFLVVGHLARGGEATEVTNHPCELFGCWT